MTLVLHVISPGIHLVHKPVGPSSFARMNEYITSVGPALLDAESSSTRRQLKHCHGGTLDPFASGLLLILIGQATKLFDHLHAIPKTYEATVRWGIETDNGDPLGKITLTGDPTSLTQQQLDSVLATFIGWHDQVPHATSAKRIGGERAYTKAHRGEIFEMPSAHVYLHEAHWLSHDLPTQSRLRVATRGGYYIRALARDLGRLLGCGAHLSELHRSAIGPWTDPGLGKAVEIRGRELLPWAPSRVLSDFEIGELRQKRAIPVGTILPPDWPLPPNFPDPKSPIRALHRDRLVFLLTQQAEQLIAQTEFHGGL